MEMFFLEMILMGICATLVMDILARVFGRLKVIRPKVSPEIIGRWSLYMLKGKFFHRDINMTPALPNEILTSWISHYAIGIVLAGIYLLFELHYPVFADRFWMAIIFGILTVFLPLLWLFPSIGIGFLASKTPQKSPYITTSLVNHTDFGLGLALWIIIFRPIFV